MEHKLSHLTTHHLPYACRLLASACCPDKDLVVLLTRSSTKVKMSLWKMQGSKRWEVDLVMNQADVESVVELTWSPDGRTIAVARHPPSITLHSLQDGHLEQILSLVQPSEIREFKTQITGMWWFDNFGKLRGQTQGFYLQNAGMTSEYFDMMSSWPTLGSASKQMDGALDSRSLKQHYTMLAVADGTGNLSLFLNGTYSIGSISVGQGQLIPTLFKVSTSPMIFLHLSASSTNTLLTALRPLVIHLPLQSIGRMYEVAKLSSVMHGLVLYGAQTIREMRNIWVGSDAVSGPRVIGAKWLSSLEATLGGSLGSNQLMTYLSHLLLTGNAIDDVGGIFGSHEHFGEKMIDKWEYSVTDALVKIREYSVRQLVPALRRAYLLLEELRGWSQSHQLASLDFDLEEVEGCLTSCKRCIFHAQQLACEAQQESARLKHFLNFLRYEARISSPSTDITANPDFDSVEAYSYLTSGLVNSRIDQWFHGEEPVFCEYSGAPPNKGLMLQKARCMLLEASSLSPQVISPPHGKNMEQMMHLLLSGSQRISSSVSCAIGQSLALSADYLVSNDVEADNTTSHEGVVVRQHLVEHDHVSGRWSLYLAFPVPSISGSVLCLARKPYGSEKGWMNTSKLEVVLLQCQTIHDTTRSEENVNISDVEFFDDEFLLLTYKAKESEGTMRIGMIRYQDLELVSLTSPKCTNIVYLKELMENVLYCWSDGLLSPVCEVIKHQGELSEYGGGSLSLAVNGRSGRRVICVLNEEGYTMEIFEVEDYEVV